MKRNRRGWLVAVLILGLGIPVLGQCLHEVEDNNSGSMADWVAALPGSGCIDGSIGVVGDIDFYYFDLTSAHWVTIETITQEDTEIGLLDAEGNALAQNDDIALNVLSSRIEKYLEVGRYFVGVWEHGDDNVVYSYALNVYTEGCTQEMEDNDSFALADYIGQVPGEACAVGSIGVVGDVDVFAFDVTDWTVVTLSTVTNEDTEIALLDEAGNTLAVNDDYIVNEYWSWIQHEVSPGTYYVMVWEHGDDNVIYDYTLMVSGSNCISEVEPNDDYTLADDLGSLPGQACAAGAIGTVGDLDYFRFEVAAAVTVTISTETTGDTEIGLFDAVGNTLAVNDDVSVGDTSSWIQMELAAGVYYIAVREFMGSSTISSYTLYITGQ